MAKSWSVKSAAKILENAAKATVVVSAVHKAYESSELKVKVDGHAETIKEKLKESGVTDRAKALAGTVDQHLDTLSGQKLLALVEERLDLQMKYNDVLATKLSEALDRIAQLEKKVTESVQKGS